ncbi:hypothetical protein BDV93DRAFT_493895 [Ceratobasidium sp. AG-I]|nr:hypothetical protein BDV93DRAFT_493895 [Ceratobasidium sp. AG-I]
MRNFSKDVWPGESQIILGIDIGTTHSAVSFAHLFKGGPQTLHRVTDWPGQKAQKGESKIPTLVYYDSNNQAVCFGADALRDEIMDQVEDEGWSVARHFKLHLHPESMRAGDNLALQPLPCGVSLDTIYTDFLKYLLQHTQSFFERRIVDGQKIWQERSQNMLVILTHPNGWAIREQNFLRQAIRKVQFSYSGSCRVSFVSEAEASIHFCLFHSSMESTQLPNTNLIVCDAGGSTIDTTSYHVERSSPTLELKEQKASACLQTGGLQVDLEFKQYLEEHLTAAGLDQGDLNEYVSAGVRDFESTAKKEFDSLDATYYINFRDSKFNASNLGIRRGRMELRGTTIETFFKPSVSDTVRSVKAQATGLSPKYVLLVGGFGESLYLHRKLSLELSHHSCQVTVIEDSTSKAAADGAVIWATKLAVVGRVTRVSYGMSFKLNYDPLDPEHQGRKVFRGLWGNDRIDGEWWEIIGQGVVLSAQEPVRQRFSASCKSKGDAYTDFDRADYAIWAFHGEQGTNPGWITNKDGHTNPGFEKLCYVEAKFSDMRGAFQRKEGKDGPFDWFEASLAVRLGGTEFSAQIEWEEEGVLRSGPATILPEPLRLPQGKNLSG